MIDASIPKQPHERVRKYLTLSAPTIFSIPQSQRTTMRSISRPLFENLGDAKPMTVKRTNLSPIAIILRAAIGAMWLLATTLSSLAATTILPSGETCFSATTGISGMIGLLGTITGGSGGTNGTYGGVAITGGSGSGATATIVVSGSAVTAVTILNPGIQYKTGDTLSASSPSIGGVSGFSVPVLSTAINGSLAAGQVFMYVPNTTTPKQTWQDSGQATLNSEPIILDANGCALIYGVGSYRQILEDSLGNLVWDQITTDTSAYNSTFWAGQAGGTPNAITITDPGFNGTDGSVVNFTAFYTNTGAATLNPSSFGAVPIEKDTTAGPVALVGGEIVQTNPISVIFRAVDNAFHILNPPIQSSNGSTAPLCGAVGLAISNANASPTTELSISAANALTVSSTGNVLNRSNVALTLNFSTNGVNGLDTGSFTASTTYYLYLIDSGAAAASLASLSSTNPTLPSGYSFSCRVGAISTNGSTQLLSVQQFGNRTTVLSSGLTVAPQTGSCNSSFTAESFANQVPATAREAFGQITTVTSQTAGIGLSATGPVVASASPSGAGAQVVSYYEVPLTTASTVYYCSTSTSNGLLISGWVDSVNAQ